MMLSRSNKDRYRGLKAKIENTQFLGRDDFPKTQEDLVGILNNFKDEMKKTMYDKLSATEKVLFANNGEVVGQANPAAGPAAAVSGVKMNKAVKSACHECGAKDHWPYKYPKHTADERARLRAIYDRRHPAVDGVVAAQVGETVGVGENLQAPPNEIAKEHIDGVAKTERVDDTSPPSPLLGVSLLAANRPGRRVA